ncbi:hypothetical protein SDC9_134185 [bioreactor metagenome]|uniref:Uncharacterized protein n=1 Tax=bioreactor metagenome TaxID=1076179 RepID=A0A645DES7_9ZZZZ
MFCRRVSSFLGAADQKHLPAFFRNGHSLHQLADLFYDVIDTSHLDFKNLDLLHFPRFVDYSCVIHNGLVPHRDFGARRFNRGVLCFKSVLFSRPVAKGNKAGSGLRDGAREHTLLFFACVINRRRRLGAGAGGEKKTQPEKNQKPQTYSHQAYPFPFSSPAWAESPSFFLCLVLTAFIRFIRLDSLT